MREINILSQNENTRSNYRRSVVVVIVISIRLSPWTLESKIDEYMHRTQLETPPVFHVPHTLCLIRSKH